MQGYAKPPRDCLRVKKKKFKRLINIFLNSIKTDEYNFKRMWKKFNRKKLFILIIYVINVLFRTDAVRVTKFEH